MACKQIVEARKERDDALRLARSQETTMATEFASINAALLSQGEMVPANRTITSFCPEPLSNAGAGWPCL